MLGSVLYRLSVWSAQSHAQAFALSGVPLLVLAISSLVYLNFREVRLWQYFVAILVWGAYVVVCVGYHVRTGREIIPRALAITQLGMFLMLIAVGAARVWELTTQGG